MAGPTRSDHQRWRLGAVSFLNARPLVEGLDEGAGFELTYDVPAALPALLDAGQVDAALVPVIDLARRGSTWQPVSDACIGSDGETLTVRVYSRRPPEQMTTLQVDGDSHTSVVLAQVLWNELYGTGLQVEALSPGRQSDAEAILLIGDKVVTQRPAGFEFDIDLGGAWRSLTGLPFVFAVWCKSRDLDPGDLPELLAQARDRGVDRALAIAAECAPGIGWPVETARKYLTEHLSYTLTPRHRQGLARFFELAAKWRLAPPAREVVPA
ncbi:MAG: menaquinone biosynthesis protein [bacterium]|nr:menaquinone biosynthesis protein [bacterium]